MREETEKLLKAKPHQGNPVPRVASQRGTSEEGQWKVEDVR